jgi:hypothetical protein
MCPIPECGREATVVSFVCELVFMPSGTTVADLERKPPFGELVRCFLADCPSHGQVHLQEPGHHVTNIPKKARGTRRRSRSRRRKLGQPE